MERCGAEVELPIKQMLQAHTKKKPRPNILEIAVKFVKLIKRQDSE